MTITWGGDLTLGSSHGLPPDRGRPQLAAVASELRAADLAAVNYEGTFAPGGRVEVRRPRRRRLLRVPGAAAERGARSARAGVDLVNLANNHAFDFGPAGYRRAGRARPRGRAGDRRARRGAACCVAPAAVAFVGFASYPWSGPICDLPRVRAQVRAARRRADLVVVLFHGGAEGAGGCTCRSATSMRSARTAATCARFAHAASTPAPTSCSAPARTCCAGWSATAAGSSPTRSATVGLAQLRHGRRPSFSALLRVELSRRGRLRAGRVTSLRLVGSACRTATRRRRRAVMRALSRSDFGRRARRPCRASAVGPSRWPVPTG